MTPTLLIGTSGYAYDEWAGVFYPPRLPKATRLDFYASVFNALEVNSTYYGTPKPSSAKRLVAEARGRLAISVKAPGDLTHRARSDSATVRPFLEYLEPIREADVLTAVLLQFPNALHHDQAARAQLQQAIAALAGIPLAVELRHSSWDTPEADAYLRDQGVSRVAVDQPDLRGLSESRRLALTGPLAYFRYHGRNATAWYGDERSTGDARYRYRYTAEELEPWIPTVRDASEKATTTLAFFNNHPDGNAVLDAMSFSTLLGQPRELPRENDLFG